MFSSTAAAVGGITVKRLKEDGCMVTVLAEAGPLKVNESFQNALVQVQARAQLPGFRVGKVPLGMIKQNFAGQIKERALDNMIRASLEEVFMKEKIVPVVPPVLKKAEFDENKPMRLEMEIEVPPNIDPKNYANAALLKRKAQVEDAQVDEQLNAMREHNARLEPEADGAAVGPEHFVIVDYAGYKDGVEVPEYSAKGEMVDMSAPQTLAGLCDAIKGAKKGETREFESQAGGGKATFKVTVSEIKKKVLPPLDDSLAKEHGLASVAEMKNRMKEMLAKQAADEAERDLVYQLEEHLLKENKFSAPKSLVEHHTALAAQRVMDRLMPAEKEKITPEQHAKMADRLRPAVERDIKVGYIIHAIAKKENLDATAKDLEDELERALSRTASDEDKARVREFFESRRSDITATITEKKVVEFLKSSAKITEAKC